MSGVLLGHRTGESPNRAAGYLLMVGLGDGEDRTSVSVESVVTKGGRGANLAVVTALVLMAAIVAWVALSGDTSTHDRSGLGEPIESGSAEPSPALLMGPTPTVRWETPPKFGGHGDSSVNGPKPRSTFGGGRYR